MRDKPSDSQEEVVWLRNSPDGILLDQAGRLSFVDPGQLQAIVAAGSTSLLASKPDIINFTCPGPVKPPPPC